MTVIDVLTEAERYGCTAKYIHLQGWKILKNGKEVFWVTDGILEKATEGRLRKDLYERMVKAMTSTVKKETPEKIRKFSTGATRDLDKDKLDYEGFFSPIVLKEFAAYMHEHRIQPDGELRDSDNWQKGMPIEEYMKSLLRHVMDAWLEHRGHKSREGMKKALCGIMFNSMGCLYEILQEELNKP